MSGKNDVVGSGVAGLALQGLLWASQQYGWQVPSWVAHIVFAVSLVLIAYTAWRLFEWASPVVRERFQPEPPADSTRDLRTLGLAKPQAEPTPLDSRNVTGVPAAPASERPTKPEPPEIDTWLVHAVHYIIHREWLTKQQRAQFSLENAMGAAIACGEMRRSAAKGALIIEGKLHPDQIPTPIDPSFWIHHGFDVESIQRGKAKNVASRHLTPFGPGDQYFSLMVSKAQVEKLWPPKARGASESHRLASEKV
jgi:hypothetical protein